MKKILSFITLFIALQSFVNAQVIVQRSLPTVTAQDARLYTQYNFGLPRYKDTAAANANLGIDSCGTMIWTYDQNAIWYRSCSPKHWTLITDQGYTNNENRLIFGSATWSGSGLTYDVLNPRYYIQGNYFSVATTQVTLSAADPSNPRIDNIIVDNTPTVGVLTGTAAPSPTTPTPNGLSQLSVSTVLVGAGATTPTGVTATYVYRENIEWTPSSDIPSINYAYTTNPHAGTYSVYVPSAPNGSYLSFQNGSPLTTSDYQYLKLWIRLNGALVGSPTAFASLSLYNGSTQVSSNMNLSDGQYGFNASTLNTWQLLVIPMSSLTITGNTFNKLYIQINSGAPSSFQLDDIYFISGQPASPIISNVWHTDILNDVSTNSSYFFGTGSANPMDIYAGGSKVISFLDTGIPFTSDTTKRQLLWDPTTKIAYWGYQPNILADSPLVIYYVGYDKHIKCDGCADTTAPAGSNTQVQYNNNGAFGASANFTASSTDVNTWININSPAATKNGLTVKGASGQTSNIFSVTNSTGGTNYFNVGVDVGFMSGHWTISNDGQLLITTSNMADNVLLRLNANILPKEYDLTVNGTNGSFTITDATSSNIRFYINDTGNIGIGTSSPTDKLYVNGGIRSDHLLADITGTVDCTGCASIGIGNNVTDPSSAGASLGVGEGQTVTGEASSAIYGALNNIIANDGLVGGTGSGVFENGGIALGVAAQSSGKFVAIAIGDAAGAADTSAVGIGSLALANAPYSGVFAGKSNTSNARLSVVLGGEGITATEDNTAYVPSFEITGNKFNVSTGSNKIAGSVTLIAGSAVVSNTSVTANSIIFLQRKGNCSSCGTYGYTVNAGSDFTITSTNGADVSTIAYVLIN